MFRVLSKKNRAYRDTVSLLKTMPMNVAHVDGKSINETLHAIDRTIVTGDVTQLTTLALSLSKRMDRDDVGYLIGASCTAVIKGWIFGGDRNDVPTISRLLHAARFQVAEAIFQPASELAVSA